MPAKSYICTNKAGGCTRAFNKELITLEAGQDPDCPVKNCRDNLKASDAAPSKGGPKGVAAGPNWLLIASLAAGLVLVAAGGFFGWREFAQPRPDRIDTELTQFYADLPAAKGETK